MVHEFFFSTAGGKLRGSKPGLSCWDYEGCAAWVVGGWGHVPCAVLLASWRAASNEKDQDNSSTALWGPIL